MPNQSYFHTTSSNLGDYDLGDLGLGDLNLGDFNLGEFELIPSVFCSHSLTSLERQAAFFFCFTIRTR